MKILLVEDNTDHRELMSLALTGHEPTWQVEEVVSGEETLSRLAEGKSYDLIILDYQLPKRDGLEVLKEIKRGVAPPPVVMITGQGDEQVAVDAMKGGTYDYIVKTEGYLQRLPVVARRAMEAHHLVVERKRAEEALAAEKERLKVTLRSIGDGVITTDVEGRVTLINNMAEELTGWTQEEAIGKPINKVFHIINEKTRERCEDPVAKVITTGMIIGLKNHTVLIARDGTERSLADSGAPILDKEGKTIGVVLIFRDITEKLKLEFQLQQSQKMEAIGTLAGGIAHHFNNILGVIMGNTELAIHHVPEWNPANECLLEIRSASLRAKDIVRQILGFARKSPAGRKPIQITPIIKDSLNLLRASTPKTIEIRQSFSCESDTILADPTQVNQILMNLCTNALQAMREKGGILEVNLENEEVGLPALWNAKHIPPGRTADLKDEKDKSEMDHEPGRYIKLTVSDTGCGMDTTIKERIFDPYFTTKGLAEGSGMGLPVVYGIVKNHDGAIRVESEPGKGTVIEVLFPCIDIEAEP
jgi:PAS domain S-box-containing protein